MTHAMHTSTRQNAGFTLIEMVGVVAVIAILASVATPMIFDAIRDARVSALTQEINTLKTASARFFADTGRFPYHRPGVANNEQLLTNPATPIAGWDGPYIESQLDVGFPQTSTIFGVWADRTDSLNFFDLDGDGTMETTGATLLWLQMDDESARQLSDALDGDGDVDTGTGAWFAAGRVKRQGVNHERARTYIVYLGK